MSGQLPLLGGPPPQVVIHLPMIRMECAKALLAAIGEGQDVTLEAVCFEADRLMAWVIHGKLPAPHPQQAQPQASPTVANGEDKAP